MGLGNTQLMNPIQQQIYQLIFNTRISSQLQTIYINMYNLTEIIN